MTSSHEDGAQAHYDRLAPSNDDNSPWTVRQP